MIREFVVSAHTLDIVGTHLLHLLAKTTFATPGFGDCPVHSSSVVPLSGMELAVALTVPAASSITLRGSTDSCPPPPPTP